MSTESNRSKALDAFRPGRPSDNKSFKKRFLKKRCQLTIAVERTGLTDGLLRPLTFYIFLRPSNSEARSKSNVQEIPPVGEKHVSRFFDELCQF